MPRGVRMAYLIVIVHHVNPTIIPFIIEYKIISSKINSERPDMVNICSNRPNNNVKE